MINELEIKYPSYLTFKLKHLKVKIVKSNPIITPYKAKVSNMAEC